MAKQLKTMRRAAPDGTPLRQIAALPYRRSAAGELQILLLTSRHTHRLIIPKGWESGAKKDWKAAEKEAREEGGVVGKIKRRPVGRFQYWKRFDDHFALVDVDVYPLKVEKRLKDWPERRQRAARWLAARDAALLVDEPRLVSLIRDFSGIMSNVPIRNDDVDEKQERTSSLRSDIERGGLVVQVNPT